MKPLRVVQAQVEDVPALHRMEKRCFPHPVDVFHPRQLRYLITSPTSITLVVRQENEIVAAVIGLLRHFAIPSGRVYKIAVDKALRGQGMGSRLIKAIERKFRQAGMVKSCAEVRVGNTASRNMFEKNGYHLTRIMKPYYLDGEDGAKYWRHL